MNIWDSVAQLTDAQASLLSTLIIVVAGGIGIVLGSWLYGNRVRDLKSALEESRGAVEGHHRALVEKLSIMDSQISATMEAMAQLRSGVSDLRDEADEQGNDLRKQLKRHWYAIRDEIQKVAANPNIHGRTRSRYAGFTNNQIDELLNALAADHNLDGRERDFREGSRLWTWHRNGRPQLTAEDVKAMRDIAMRSVPGYQPD